MLAQYDVVEDVKVDPKEIQKNFGEAVAAHAIWLTHWRNACLK
jgi:(p)ppGpp synthase/HD superfamily hydrolase